MTSKITKPCVYCILNIQNNNKYVGSTAKFTNRKNQHLYNLRRGNHYSPKMQNDYNKYGENNFRFYILEDVETFDRNYLFEREQYWMDKYAPEYNVSKVAGDVFPKWIYTQEWKENIRKSMTGRKQSQEEKDKRAQSIRNFWKDKKKVIPPEQREKLRQANLGEKNPNWGLKRSDDTRNKMSNSNSKIEYTFESPDGVCYNFRNLSKAPINVPYWVLRDLYRGIRKDYFGWKFISSRKLE